MKWPRLQDWGILLAAFMLASLPMIGHYLDKPESFASRVEDVVIFSERNWAILTDRAGEEVLDVLRYQVSRILNGLFYAEDASSRYNALGGLMGPFLTPLALLGYELIVGYIVSYPARDHVSQMPHTELAALIADVQDDHPVYVVGLPRYSSQSPVVRFLAPRAQAQDLSDEDAKNLAQSLSREAILVVFQDRVSRVDVTGAFPSSTPISFPSRYWQAWIVRS